MESRSMVWRRHSSWEILSYLPQTLTGQPSKLVEFSSSFHQWTRPSRASGLLGARVKSSAPSSLHKHLGVRSAALVCISGLNYIFKNRELYFTLISLCHSWRKFPLRANNQHPMEPFSPCLLFWSSYWFTLDRQSLPYRTRLLCEGCDKVESGKWELLEEAPGSFLSTRGPHPHPLFQPG